MDLNLKKHREDLIFLPLGGANEIGMNLNAYGFGPEGDKKWIVVDVGVTFAGEHRELERAEESRQQQAVFLGSGRQRQAQQIHQQDPQALQDRKGRQAPQAVWTPPY
jgi:hypothetical protein